MIRTGLNATERRYLPPAVAVSTVAFALHPPAEAPKGEAPTGATSTGVDAPAAVSPREEAPREEANREKATRTTPTLWIPLVRRTRAPFADCWALPGGPIPWNETLVEAAERTIATTVGKDPGYLEQLYAFGDVGRSGKAQRLVTIAYWALYGARDLVAGTDENVAWFSADRLPELAFDHADIVDYALWRLRVKSEYTALAHRFLGEEFTLAQLRRVHEACLGESVDPANFRRQVLGQGNLVDTGRKETGTRYRPAALYRFVDSGAEAAAPCPDSS